MIPYKIFAILFSVFCYCVPIIKCNNLTVQENDSSTLNTPSEQDKLPTFGEFLLSFTNQSMTDFRKKSTSEINNDYKLDNLKKVLQEVYGNSLSKQEVGQSLVKQQAGASPPTGMSFPNLQQYFEPIRSYIKTAYRTYLLLNPEIKMGQCLYKYLYMNFPIMRFFRMSNLQFIARRAYVMMTKFFNNLLSGNIFAPPEPQTDIDRVGFKVASITKERPKPKTPQLNTINSGLYSLPQSRKNYYYLPSNVAYQPMTVTPNLVYQRVKRQTAQLPSNQQYTPEEQSVKSQQAQPKKEHPTEFTDNVQDFENMDADAKIDLSNPSLLYEADQLFNLDSMFWKSMGVEDNSIKKYSLAYCGREYTSDILKRFVKNVILS